MTNGQTDGRKRQILMPPDYRHGGIKSDKLSSSYFSNYLNVNDSDWHILKWTIISYSCTGLFFRLFSPAQQPQVMNRNNIKETDLQISKQCKYTLESYTKICGRMDFRSGLLWFNCRFLLLRIFSVAISVRSVCFILYLISISVSKIMHLWARNLPCKPSD